MLPGTKQLHFVYYFLLFATKVLQPSCRRQQKQLATRNCDMQQRVSAGEQVKTVAGQLQLLYATFKIHFYYSRTNMPEKYFT